MLAKRRYQLALTAALLGCCLGLMWAQQDSSTSGGAPDNSKNNAHQRANGDPTADQQKNNASDRSITQQIRKAIVKDKTLSTYAHNVKIVTQNGQVTLSGPVRSEEEKKAIADAASGVAGVSNVRNELQVAPKE